jgi:GDPmannose 4,6-dehydratase
MDIIVTGASGFVASHLIPKLQWEGNVIGIDRKKVNINNCKYVNELCDIRDFAAMARIIERIKPKYLFHLASQSFVPESFRDPINTFMVNSLGTQNVLEAVRQFSPQSRIIFAGTSEEYGLQFPTVDEWIKAEKKYGRIEPQPNFKDEIDSELPIDEQNPLRPMSPYAVSKVHGDYMMRNYHTTYGLDTVVSRAFNHEGSNRGREFVTAKIVRELVECYHGERKEIRLGDPTVTRDWSHVDDICNGYILLAEKAEPGSVYVQGSGVETSIEDFYKQVSQRLFCAEYNGIKWNCPEFSRPSDVPYLQADPSKIKKLGWKPKKDLKDIIEDMINYYMKKHLN